MDVHGLLNEGADPRVGDEGDYLNTPLHYCCRHSKINICKILVRAGAVVDQVNELGISALGWVVARGHVPSGRALARGRSWMKPRPAPSRRYAVMFEQPSRSGPRTASAKWLIRNARARGRERPAADTPPPLSWMKLRPPPPRAPAFRRGREPRRQGRPHADRARVVGGLDADGRAAAAARRALRRDVEFLSVKVLSTAAHRPRRHPPPPRRVFALRTFSDSASPRPPPPPPPPNPRDRAPGARPRRGRGHGRREEPARHEEEAQDYEQHLEARRERLASPRSSRARRRSREKFRARSRTARRSGARATRPSCRRASRRRRKAEEGRRRRARAHDPATARGRADRE